MTMGLREPRGCFANVLTCTPLCSCLEGARYAVGNIDKFEGTGVWSGIKAERAAAPAQGPSVQKAQSSKGMKGSNPSSWKPPPKK